MRQSRAGGEFLANTTRLWQPYISFAFVTSNKQLCGSISRWSTGPSLGITCSAFHSTANTTGLAWSLGGGLAWGHLWVGGFGPCRVHRGKPNWWKADGGSCRFNRPGSKVLACCPGWPSNHRPMSGASCDDRAASDAHCGRP